MMDRVDGHRTAERRSLAYHREIARRLRADPGLVDRARAIVRARVEAGDHGACAWRSLLDGPVEDIIHAITADHERMADLRQMTPFLGILEPRERWALWRKVR